jgi:hypothetical protein
MLNFLNKNFTIKKYALLFVGVFFLSLFFVDKSFAQEVCVDQNDCANGYTCSADDKSITGRSCIRNFTPPTTANKGDRCGNGLICGSNLICRNNICTKKVSGESCNSVLECDEGFSCSNNKCTLITGTNELPPNINALKNQKLGQYCSERTVETDCVKSQTGLECVNGKCAEPFKNPLPSSVSIPPAAGLVPCSSPGLFQMDGKGPCLPKEAFDCNKDSLACSGDLKEFIIKIIKFLLTMSGVVAVVAIMIGGFWYMTAAGNEEQAEKGKNTLTNFFLGLVVILMAYALVTILNNLLTQGK